MASDAVGQQARRHRRLAGGVALLAVAALGLRFVLVPGGSVRETLLNALLYFPDATLYASPDQRGLAYEEIAIETGDGERLHGWWVPAATRPSLGHLLHCHGNGGNISMRIDVAERLSRAGLDVLLFDYRGYGRSSGRPSEAGTYRDARAARRALLELPGVESSRLLYYGESLGGAIALELALEEPPRGLVLQSSFTSIRAMGRALYPVIPATLVPDAYPSLERIPRLRAPLLLLHGEEDEIVPLAQGRALFEAAPEPKQLRVFAGVGHNDLLARRGDDWQAAIAEWVRALPSE
jgi:fermentation-respiration switch protein FrsA (DUF1100 family)